MSYLVDALKKAERERHEQRGANIQSVSADGAGSGSTARVLRWVVIALVVCNLGLLVYVMWPEAPAASGLSAQENAAGKTATLPLNPALSATPPAAGPADAPVRPSPTRRLDASVYPAERRPADPRKARERVQLGRGLVTYAPAPLDDRPASPQTEQENAPSIQDLGSSVPDVAINGHLYSSVPGRSFILVNGRRYHEGERMAAGPAVESIDVTGATLNYRGQRYHVNGPG